MTAVRSLATSLLCGGVTAMAWSAPCPEPPRQLSQSVRSEVEVAAIRIGKFSLGGAKGEVATQTQDLLGKYQDAGLLYVVQMMGSTFCGLINSGATLSDREKLAHWLAFQESVFQFLANRPAPDKAPTGSSTLQKLPPPPPPVLQVPVHSSAPALPPAETTSSVRAEWFNRYFYGGFEKGTWNVIVASFEAGGGDMKAASRDVDRLAKLFPQVYFRLSPSVASDGVSNPRLTCYIANVATQQEAAQIAAWARKAGIARDAFYVEQSF